MIKVTRLDGRPLVVNADLVLFVEPTPDTVITLSNREKVVVKESIDEVMKSVVKYQQEVRCGGRSTQQ